MKGKTIICKECKQEREHHARGMCQKCYSNWYIINNANKIAAYEATRYNKHSKNRDCSMFLGCHIAERMLSKIFKNVKVMPRNNPGYDFICNHGKKIDVKSACLPTEPNSRQRWQFNINQNTIADFFLCIAFDNRADLNPMHLWLVPGNKIGHLSNIKISKHPKTTKWNKFALDLTKSLTCCNNIK